MKFKAIFAILPVLAGTIFGTSFAAGNGSPPVRCGMTVGPQVASLDSLTQLYFPAAKSYAEVQSTLLANIPLYYAAHNANDPHQAKVVVFGEDHTNPGERFATQTLINGLAKIGDVVLIEGAPAGIIVPGLGKFNDQTKLLKAGLWPVGWDDMDAFEQTLEAFRDRDTAYTEELVGSINMRLNSLIVSRDRELTDALDGITKVRPNAKIFVIVGYEHTSDSTFEDYLDAIGAASLDPIPSKWERYKKETAIQYSNDIQKIPLGAVLQVDNSCGILR